jgi:hypothetical protein
MAKEADRGSRTELRVSFGEIARVLDVGPAAARAAALRLGIEPLRSYNGREFLSVTDAQTLLKGIGARKAG